MTEEHKQALIKLAEEMRKQRARKEENNKLLDVINNQDVKIADLENKNTNLRGIIKNMGACMPNCKQFRQLEQAKRIIKDFIAICDFGTEEDYNLRCRAEQFLEGKNG